MSLGECLDRRRVAAYSGVAAVALIAGVLAVSLLSGPDIRSGVAAPVSALSGRLDKRSPKFAIPRVPTLLRENFSIFRHGPGGLPADVRQTLGQSYSRGNWSLARTLQGAPWKAWAVPANKSLCLLSEEVKGGAVSVTCVSQRHAVTQGIFVATLPTGGPIGLSPKRIVFGIVPDGTRSVRIETGLRAARTVRPEGNLFALEDMVPVPPKAAVLSR
jgi:hypothetical protein